MAAMLKNEIQAVRHRGLEDSMRTSDGTGYEFEFW